MNKQRSRAGQADTLPNVKPKERIMANPSKNQTEQVQAAVKTGQDNMEKAVKAGSETVQKAVKASKENAEKAYKAGTEAFQKGYEQAVAMTSEQVKKAFPQAADKFDEFAAVNKGNIDALFAASEVAAKGFEQIADEMMAYNQKAFETHVATTKAFFECKSLTDLVELQTSYARAAFDRAVAEGTKLSEMTVKVANQAVEPIQVRVNKTMEQFAKPLAA